MKIHIPTLYISLYNSQKPPAILKSVNHQSHEDYGFSRLFMYVRTVIINRVLSFLHAGYTSLSLVLIAIISTLLLGLLFGSLIFVFSMWRLRQRNSLEDNGLEEGGNSPLACNPSFRSSPVTNIKLNAAYGHPLGGSTTILLPPRFEHRHNLTENEVTYEAITDMYPSSTTEITPLCTLRRLKYMPPV